MPSSPTKALPICLPIRPKPKKMPQDLNGLHDIYGLGEAKIDRFGHGILEVCRNAAGFSRDAVIRPQTEREQQLRQKLEPASARTV